MPEFQSRQSAKIALGQKLNANENGRERTVVIQSPVTHAILNGDTVASGVIIPAGARFTADSLVRCAALGASVTMSIGIRDPITKVAIDATAIASALAVATAQAGLAANNGTKMTNGQEYVTTQDVEPYLTFGGANLTANTQFVAEVRYIGGQ